MITMFSSKMHRGINGNQVFTILLGILLSVIFARLTSKELFGEYNFLNSVIAIVSIVADSWA